MTTLNNISNRQKIKFFFTFIFLVLITYKTFEDYMLLDKVIFLLQNIVEVKVNNIINLKDSYILLYDCHSVVLGISREEARAILKVLKKLPIVLLFTFFLLIAANYLLLDNFSNASHYILIGIEHIGLHQLVEFFESQKEKEHYPLLCSINRIKRYLKNCSKERRLI